MPSLHKTEGNMLLFLALKILLNNPAAKIAVTHEQEVTKEVGHENLLQAVSSDAVLLCKNPLTGCKHCDDTTAMKMSQKFELCRSSVIDV